MQTLVLLLVFFNSQNLLPKWWHQNETVHCEGAIHTRHIVPNDGCEVVVCTFPKKTTYLFLICGTDEIQCVAFDGSQESQCSQPEILF